MDRDDLCMAACFFSFLLVVSLAGPYCEKNGWVDQKVAGLLGGTPQPLWDAIHLKNHPRRKPAFVAQARVFQDSPARTERAEKWVGMKTLPIGRGYSRSLSRSGSLLSAQPPVVRPAPADHPNQTINTENGSKS